MFEEFDQLSAAQMMKKIRAKDAGHEHWIGIADRVTRHVLQTIEQKYYKNPQDGDFEIICLLRDDVVLFISFMRKRKMNALQLSSILRQTAKIKLTERQLLQSSFVGFTTVPNIPKAEDLIRSVLHDEFVSFSESE